MNKIDENKIEQMSIEFLNKLNSKYIYASEISPDRTISRNV
jgi:hypothetical protein